MSDASGDFIVATNPDEESTLPYLVRLPIEGGVMFKVRETWPRASRVYCHPIAEWPSAAEVIEQTPVKLCRRRGAAIDLVLDRTQNYRSQFVFTKQRDRDIVLWQTAKVTRKARPGARLPRRRITGVDALRIDIDTRERYPYRFAQRAVETARTALPAGDYAVQAGEALVAAVERKTLENFVSSVVDGSIAFVMAELSALPAAAVVVEDRYSSLLKLEFVDPGWVLELVAALQVRFPNVPIVYCESRRMAEEWTFRFLGAARRELSPDA